MNTNQQSQQTHGQPDLARHGAAQQPDGAPAAPAITTDEVRATALALQSISWGLDGLTRTQIRKQYRDLPEAIFLRLPDSKQYKGAEEVLHDAGVSASRAEGEFLGANPDLDEAESVDEGGPPAWGPSPLYAVGGTQDGGSAEDTAGLEEGE